MSVKSLRVRTLLSFLCNLAVVILSAYSVTYFFVGLSQGNMEYIGARCLRYFTIDSNILAVICCLFMAVEDVRLRSSGRLCPRRFIWLLKLTGSAAVSLTFLVVIFFLGPTMGYDKMFGGVNLYLHAICPILSDLSLILFEYRSSERKKGDFLYGAIPAFIYATVYLIMVVFVKGWPDFYGFNIGGFWFVSYPAIIGIAALISFGLFSLTRDEVISPVEG